MGPEKGEIGRKKESELASRISEKKGIKKAHSISPAQAWSLRKEKWPPTTEKKRAWGFSRAFRRDKDFLIYDNLDDTRPCGNRVVAIGKSTVRGGKL